jgi:hypothetical protein
MGLKRRCVIFRLRRLVAEIFEQLASGGNLLGNYCSLIQVVEFLPSMGHVFSLFFPLLKADRGVAQVESLLQLLLLSLSFLSNLAVGFRKHLKQLSLVDLLISSVLLNRDNFEL